MDPLSDKKDMLDSRIVNALRACSDALQRQCPNVVAELILFGSQATGHAAPESDVDVLALVEEDISPEMKKTIHDTVYEVSLDFDVVISVLITTRRQWDSPVTQLLPIYRNIAKEGIRVA